VLVSMVPNGDLAKVQTHWLEMGDFRRFWPNGSAVWRIPLAQSATACPDRIDPVDTVDTIDPADPVEGSL